MKIALIRQRYTQIGGAERFVDLALRALRERGAEVSLICRNWQAGQATDAGAQVIVCNPPAARLGGRRARDHSFAEAVRALIARERFDIVQSHERIPGCQVFRAGDGVHAAWLEQLARVRHPLRRAALRLAPYHRYVLQAEAEMFAHPALRAVICNSHMVRAEIIRYYGLAPERLHVIPNGVDAVAFHPDKCREYRGALRGLLGIGTSDRALLFVGAGFERKGLFRLLPAFAALSDTRAYLIVVGGDRQMRAAQRLASKLGIAGRVHFAGPQADVRPYLGAADAFALPTLYDPLPNAALEALATGLPVLTSTSCGAAELIRTGESGYVCDALDSAAITEAIAHLLAGACSSQAAREAVSGLSPSVMAERLVSLYQQLMDTRDSSARHGG